MTKTLYVPDHVAASKNAAVSSAYVEKNQKVLDVFKGFITSDRKFAQCYVNFLFQKGNLNASCNIK